MSRILKGMNCAGTIQNPDALFICAKAKRQQQLRQGEIDPLHGVGEDALMNVSIERTASGALAGNMRIRAVTKGIALGLGDKVLINQRAKAGGLGTATAIVVQAAE